MGENRAGHLAVLRAVARQAMVDRGLEPDFPPDALRQVAELQGPAMTQVEGLRRLPWFSIDNEDSRDLDQLTAAEPTQDGAIRVRVAIADVDELVKAGTPVDAHARGNTTSVYTAAGVFPMLPERLSTDLTSLNERADRLAIVISYVVDQKGAITQSEVGRAQVRNHAKLAYPEVSTWLAAGPRPAALTSWTAGGAYVRLHDEVAQRLRRRRQEEGALDLQTTDVRTVVSGTEVTDLREQAQDRAQELIEDLMIAANGVAARFLRGRAFPSLRRVVREPKRWPRIVALAATFGDALPDAPDARALEEFLVRRRKADALRFPDLSLSLVKLLGRGEYVVEQPSGPTEGHFGLAMRDYVHATAPNRRYPDLVTQRLLKAALTGAPSPYSVEDLSTLAVHCTKQEDAAEKVERQVSKSAAALLLSTRIGDTFDAIVTGASPKGTWVRTLRPPVEGKVVRGEEGLDVGDEVKVRLAGLDVERGFIDFVRGGS